MSPTDTLSLTLPKAITRVKRRFRRPRKPSPSEMWWLAWAGFSAGVAIQQSVANILPWAAFATWCAAVYWRGYQRARRGLPGVEWQLAAVVVGVDVVLLVVGA